MTDRPVDRVFEVPEQDRARLLSIVSGEGDRRVGIRTGAGQMELPDTAGRAVLLLLEELGSGSSVHVVATDADMTTQQAADLLGLSRTYVIRLIEGDKLPARRVGTHRRLRAADVLAYKERRAARLSRVDVVWTEEILEEVRRNVIADHPDIDPDRFATHTLAAMRSAFPEANVTGIP